MGKMRFEDADFFGGQRNYKKLNMRMQVSGFRCIIKSVILDCKMHFSLI